MCTYQAPVPAPADFSSWRIQVKVDQYWMSRTLHHCALGRDAQLYAVRHSVDQDLTVHHITVHRRFPLHSVSPRSVPPQSARSCSAMHQPHDVALCSALCNKIRQFNHNLPIVLHIAHFSACSLDTPCMCHIPMCLHCLHVCSQSVPLFFSNFISKTS